MRHASGRLRNVKETLTPAFGLHRKTGEKSLFFQNQQRKRRKIREQTRAGGLPRSMCGCSARRGHQPAPEKFLPRALGDPVRVPRREHGRHFPAPRERHIFFLAVYESLTYSPYDTALEDHIFYLLCLAIVLVTN